MKRIRSGDLVIVTTGKSKGHKGAIKKIIGQRVIVEGANLVKKAIKPNPQLGEKGGIMTIEASIDISNVALFNTVTKKADKVGFRLIHRDGKTYKVRYFKSNNELVDAV